MQTKIAVRYAETDQMGVVHHSVYPVWFEVGRTEFMDNTGLKYSDIEKMGIILPLVHLECNYKRPAKYGDEITITTKINNLTCARIEFYYEVANQAGMLLATGITMHAWADNTLKPININKTNPELLTKIECFCKL